MCVDMRINMCADMCAGIDAFLRRVHPAEVCEAALLRRQLERIEGVVFFEGVDVHDASDRGRTGALWANMFAWEM